MILHKWSQDGFRVLHCPSWIPCFIGHPGLHGLVFFVFYRTMILMYTHTRWVFRLVLVFPFDSCPEAQSLIRDSIEYAMCVVWRFFNLPCLRMSPVCVRLWVFFSQVICVFLSWTIFISWVFCFLVCRHAFSVVASALVCHGQFLCCVFNNSRTRLGFPVRGRWFCEWLFSLGFIWR